MKNNCLWNTSKKKKYNTKTTVYHDNAPDGDY